MKKRIIIALMACVSLVLSNCTKDKESNSGAEYDETPYVMDHGNFPAPNIASDNKLTVEGVTLGRMLFYETKLSKDNSMSCASCHRQEDAFTDTAKFSTGVQGKLGGRQAMAIFNMAWNTNGFFWDGRAHLLRDQSLLPIQDALEMDETLDNVVAKLNGVQLYKDQFMRAFGSEEITSEKMSLAMEQFMNSIVSNNSKHDQVMSGTARYSASEKRGRDLFFLEYNPGDTANSGADCAHCHGGFNFENDRYMNNGLDETFADNGRSDVVMDDRLKGAFKVPSLRNVELTFPYMHDGRFQTLMEVIEHYNSGIKNSPTVNPAIANTRATGLMLSEQDKEDLVAFLKTLTDESLRTNKAYSNPF